MTRPRLLTAAVLAGLVLAGPAGIATAEDDPSPSPSAGSGSALAEGNQAPMPLPDDVTVEAGTAVRIDVLGNDEDDGQGRPEGEEPRLDVIDLSTADAGFSFSPTDVTFTSGAGQVGTFEADYEISDGELTASAHITVQVVAPPKRAVTISMADRPVALKTYSISGVAKPLTAGRAVVRVQRRTPDGWVRFAKDSTGVDGSYSVEFRTSTPGTRKFRAVAVWADGRKATSDPISRTVRAVANAVVSGPLTPNDVPHSWRAGCPVGPAKLRMIHINRWSYENRVARGKIVVRAGEAGAIVKVLTAAINNRFPIRSLKPTDFYYDGGRRTPMESDKAAMRAGNTSAFNCRPVTGNPYRVSQHSYGNAVDINTIENPYVTGSTVYPAGSREYLDRSPYRRGMILSGGVIASKMRGLGWLWGARWSHPDYQHFSSNGG